MSARAMAMDCARVASAFWNASEPIETVAEVSKCLVFLVAFALCTGPRQGIPPALRGFLVGGPACGAILLYHRFSLWHPVADQPGSVTDEPSQRV